jgi:hypothetical protein
MNDHEARGDLEGLDQYPEPTKAVAPVEASEVDIFEESASGAADASDVADEEATLELQDEDIDEDHCNLSSWLKEESTEEVLSGGQSLFSLEYRAKTRSVNQACRGETLSRIEYKGNKLTVPRHVSR